jgi:chaperonin GroEL (HSP60 family)
MMVTNDGATILKSIALDNAAAKILVCTRTKLFNQQS